MDDNYGNGHDAQKNHNPSHDCRRFQRHRLEFHNLYSGRHCRDENLRKYHKYFLFLRPLVLLVNLFILYLLFRLFGLKTISLFFALLIALIAITQFIFFRRIEKRILAPVDNLIQGVQQIAQGNYDVQVLGYAPNDIGSLINSFNDMAQKLYQSEKVKSAYEENRKDLIASISHDLKTPIASMQGYLEALVDGIVSPDKVELYLKTIYHNTTYMNKLIDDLFLFTKLDMQKLDFQFNVVPIQAFMFDMWEEFRFELEERQCQFIYNDCLNSDCLTYLDGKRIHQAIRNIVGNAVKYGPIIGLAITAQLSRQADQIRVDISDNGPGIDPEKIPHIFERFYRVDQARTKDLMSTGLGLAIAKELIEAHHGHLNVSSDEGMGTRFSIMLPIASNKERAQI